jgi:hypothetical protein
MLWAAGREWVQSLFRIIAYGRVDGTAGAAREAEPILVDTTGKVQVSAPIEYITHGPFNVVVGAAIGYTPWIDLSGSKGQGWYVHNTGAAATTQTYYGWAYGLGGVTPVTPFAVANAIAIGATEYSAKPTGAAFWQTPYEWAPLFARSVRLGVFAGGAATTCDIYMLEAVW